VPSFATSYLFLSPTFSVPRKFPVPAHPSRFPPFRDFFPPRFRKPTFRHLYFGPFFFHSFLFFFFREIVLLHHFHRFLRSPSISVTRPDKLSEDLSAFLLIFSPPPHIFLRPDFFFFALPSLTLAVFSVIFFPFLARGADSFPLRKTEKASGERDSAAHWTKSEEWCFFFHVGLGV